MFFISKFNFRTYGNVKSVRLPRKLNELGQNEANLHNHKHNNHNNHNNHSKHRGFAFVEFMTVEDAKVVIISKIYII